MNYKYSYDKNKLEQLMSVCNVSFLGFGVNILLYEPYGGYYMSNDVGVVTS